MDKLRWIVNTVLLLILIDLAFFGYIYMRNTYPEETKTLSINYWIQRENVVSNLNADISMINDNLRFNHNEISFFIDDKCDVKKKNDMLTAFMIISNKTDILKFYPSNFNSADITVSCSKEILEKGGDSVIAGEGGPKFTNSTIYPLINHGEITLYGALNCNQPITELHELLHVLGFNHINDPKDLMYPYLSCD